MKIIKSPLYRIFHIICVLALSVFLVQCTAEFENFFGEDTGEVKDKEYPVLYDFYLTSENPTMNTAIAFILNGSDDIGISDWLLTESPGIPNDKDPAWRGSRPSTFSFETTDIGGARTIYAWAKDESGKISNSLSIAVVYNLDSIDPTLSTFTPTSSVPTNDPTITFALDASDNSTYLKWIIKESTTPPGAADPDWSSTLPDSSTVTGSYTIADSSSSGDKNLYIWVMDPQGNMSVSYLNFPVDLDIDVPTISEFSLTSSAVTNDHDITFSLVGTDAYVSTSPPVHWIITESNRAPSVDDAGWSADETPPAGYTLPAGGGSKTIYAWIKDGVGNISPSTSLTVLVDESVPVISNFALTSSALTLNPAIDFNLNGSDNNGITGWLINESAIEPDPGIGAWTVGAAPPEDYIFAAPATSETKTVYAWAKDEAGNVSASRSFTVELDVDRPTLSVFTLTSDPNTYNPDITFSLVGTDNYEVTAWLINETSTPPGLGDGAWSSLKPDAYTLSSGSGIKNVYAWARDEAGNVSNSYTPLTIGLDMDLPVLYTFTLDSSNPTDNPVITFTVTGSDGVGIAGWLINESATPPDPDTPAMGTWTGTVPGDYTFDDTITYETKNVYAWAKDAVGNVSASLTFSVDYDGEAPTLWDFSITSSNPTDQPNITFDLSGYDNFEITSWLINETSAQPALGNPSWTIDGTAPAGYTFEDPGTFEIKTVYAWAKDGVGNISAPLSRTVFYMNDIEVPTLSKFSRTSPSPTDYVEITFDLEGTDNILVDSWMIRETGDTPGIGDADWLDTKPGTYTLSAVAGTKTVYAWAKDPFGNISIPLSFPVVLNVDGMLPSVNTFLLTSNNPTNDSVVTFTLSGTDNYNITGWLINEVGTKPSPGTGAWTADDTPPVDYTLNSPSSYGTRTIYAWAKDAAGNVSDSLSFTVDYDAQAPSITDFLRTSSSPTSDPLVTFNIIETDNIGVTGWLVNESSAKPASDAAGWGTEPGGYTLAGGDGPRTLYVWVKDAANNVSNLSSDVVNMTLDTAVPVLTDFSLTSPPSTDSYDITFSLTGNDATTSITDWIINESSTKPLFDDPDWLTGSAPGSYTMSSGNESKTIYAWAKDEVGNVSDSMSFAVTYDDDVPVVDTFSLVGSAITASRDIAYTVEGTDNVLITAWLIEDTGVKPDAGDTDWAFPASGTFQVSAGSGMKTVYAWAKDDAGNVSVSPTKTITVQLDVDSPTIESFSLASENPASDPTISFSLDGTDGTGTGIAEWLINETPTKPSAGDGDWTSSKPGSYDLTASDGIKTVYAWAKDNAGNITEAADSLSFTVSYDINKPVINGFALNGMTSPTNILDITFTLTGTDSPGSGITHWMVREGSTAPGTIDNDWLADPAPTSVIINAGDGARSLYAWAKDAVGNVSVSYAPIALVIDTGKPVVTNFTGLARSISDRYVDFTLAGNDGSGSGIAGWMITEDSIPPLPGATGWNATLPASHMLSNLNGTINIYAWCKDNAGNVSAAYTPVTVDYCGFEGVKTVATNNASSFTSIDNVGCNVYIAYFAGALYFNKSTDGGKSWGTPLLIDSERSETGKHCNLDAVKDRASDGDDIYIAYRHDFDDDDDGFLAKSTNGGDSFTPQNLCDGDECGLEDIGRFNTVAVAPDPSNQANDTVYVTYRASHDNDTGDDVTRILVKKSTNGTASFSHWDDDHNRTDNNDNYKQVRMAMVPGSSRTPAVNDTLYIARDRLDDGNDLYVAISTDGGNSFPGYTKPVDNIDGNYSTSIAVSAEDAQSNDNVYIAHYYHGNQLKVSRSTDGGGSWNTANDGLTVDASYGDQNSIAASDEYVYVSYYGNNNLRFVKSENYGANFTPPINIHDTSNNIGLATSICTEASSVFISYVDASSSNLMFIRSSNYGDSWDSNTNSDFELPVVSSVTNNSGSPVANPTINITFNGSDNESVNGWLINEGPRPGSGNGTWGTWSGAGLPLPHTANYTLSSGVGTKTVYIWLRDTANNVSNINGNSNFTIVFNNDFVKPEITQFSLDSASPAVNPTIEFTLNGSDNIQLTGWMITENSTPPAGTDTGWAPSASKPEQYTFEDPGTFEAKTLYAWAKDFNNNVSDLNPLTSTFSVVYTTDTDPPVITDFSLTSANPTLNTQIDFYLAATDNYGSVAEWIITETSTQPGAGDGGWNSVKPTLYTISDPGTYGIKTFYAWGKDVSNNITDQAVAISTSFTVDYRNPSPPQITAYDVTAASDTSLTITWTTNTSVEGGPDSYIDYGTGTNYAGQKEEGVPGQFFTNHSLTINSLTLGTRYYFKITANTLAGTDTLTFDYMTAFPSAAANPGDAANDDAALSEQLSVLQNTNSSRDYDGSSYMVWKNGNDIFAHYFENVNVTPPAYSLPWGTDGVSIYDNGGDNIRVFSDVNFNTTTDGMAIITYEKSGTIYAKKIFDDSGSVGHGGGDWGTSAGATGISVASGTNPAAAVLCMFDGNNVYAGIVTGNTAVRTATMDIPNNPIYDFNLSFSTVVTDNIVIDPDDHTDNGTTVSAVSSNFPHVLGLTAQEVIATERFYIGDHTLTNFHTENAEEHRYMTGFLFLIGCTTEQEFFKSSDEPNIHYSSHNPFDAGFRANLDNAIVKDSGTDYAFIETAVEMDIDFLVLGGILGSSKCCTHNATSLIMEMTTNWNIDITTGETYTVYAPVLNGTADMPPVNPLFDDGANFSSTAQLGDVVVNLSHFTYYDGGDPRPNVAVVDNMFGISNDAIGMSLNIMSSNGTDYYPDDDYLILRLEDSSQADKVIETGYVTNDAVSYSLEDNINNDFFANVNVGDLVYNIDGDTYAIVVSKPLAYRLMLNKDIMSAGNRYLIFDSDEPLTESGFSTSSSPGVTFQDANASFISSGVQSGFIITCFDTGKTGFIVSVNSETQLTLDGNDVITSTGDRYSIVEFRQRVLYAYENTGNIRGVMYNLDDGTSSGSDYAIDTGNNMKNPRIVQDGTGGAFVVYENSTGENVYGKQVDEFASILLPVSGLATDPGLSLVPGTLRDAKPNGYNWLYVLSEDDGSTYVYSTNWSPAAVSFTGTDAVMAVDPIDNDVTVAFLDGNDIVIKKLDAGNDGTVLYSKTIELDPFVSIVLDLEITTDHNGGVIISWVDDRYVDRHEYLLFTQALKGSENPGDFIWDQDTWASAQDYTGVVAAVPGTSTAGEVVNEILFYNDGGAPYGGLYIWFDYRNSQPDIFFDTRSR